MKVKIYLYLLLIRIYISRTENNKNKMLIQTSTYYVSKSNYIDLNFEELYV